MFVGYAVILKVKNNIKPQNEQNFFSTGGITPSLFTSPPQGQRNFGVCSLDQKLIFLVLFLKSKGIRDQPAVWGCYFPRWGGDTGQRKRARKNKKKDR